MGAFKIDQIACGMLLQIMNVIAVPPEELKNSALHRATVNLRIAVIDRALAVISKPSTAQT